MKAVPVFRGLPVLGVLPGMILDTVGLFQRAAREVGPLARLGRGGPILVAHPADLRHVLKDNARNYVRGHTVDRIRPLLGNGLPLSDGELWLRRRRLMQPSFQRDRVDAMVATMSQVAARHLDALVPGQRLLAHDLMRRIAQEVIVATMFSDSLGADAPALDQALNEIEAYVTRWGFVPLKPPRWLPDQRRFHEAAATIDRVLQRIIDPGRFLDPDQAPGDYAYLPFGGGGHLCIGNHFALAEAAVVLAMLCQRGRLRVLRPEAVRPRAAATLKVADGLPVIFERR